MSSNGHLDARKIHGKLGHPIVDADGHRLECEPVVCFGREADDPIKGTVVDKQAALVLAGNGGRA